MRNIGQIALLTGLSQRMIRYLEEQGLVKPQRRDSGLRLFTDKDLGDILEVQRLHGLGFTYPEIRGLQGASAEEIARKGTDLLHRQYAAAIDLKERIQELEMLCFGEKRSAPTSPLGSTLDTPHRTAYRLRGAAEASNYFGEATGLPNPSLSYWKLQWLRKELPAGDFQLFEILDGSALVALWSGESFLAPYEDAWEKATGIRLGFHKVGQFGPADLKEFFGEQEIVLTHDVGSDFFVVLPYGPLFSLFGRREDFDETPAPASGLTFRPLNYQSVEDSETVARWYADPSIRHLSIPHRNQEGLANPQTAEGIRSIYKSAGDTNWMVLHENEAIGCCGIQLDPPHRLHREGKTAWLSIIIGEERFRARGIGKKVMAFLEVEARRAGANVAEVGVFEFNEPAQRLVLSAGFQPFGKRDGTTYWRGKMWPDLRFLKKL